MIHEGKQYALCVSKGNDGRFGCSHCAFSARDYKFCVKLYDLGKHCTQQIKRKDVDHDLTFFKLIREVK